MITEEMKQARADNLDFEKWRGQSDGLYHLSFLKAFGELGFTTEQLMSLLVKRLDNERDISIMEMQSMTRTLDDEPCECDECKAERGEEKEPDL